MKLFELIIYIIVSSFLLGIGFNIFSNYFAFYDKENRAYFLKLELKNQLDLISNLLLRSLEINISERNISFISNIYDKNLTYFLYQKDNNLYLNDDLLISNIEKFLVKKDKFLILEVCKDGVCQKRVVIY